MTKGKVSYNAFAIIISAVSALLGTGGVDKIVKFSVPVLQVLYPIVIVLIAITLAGKAVKNNTVVRITVYTTLVVSLMDTINILTGGNVVFIKSLLGIIPLSNVGFSWLLPSVIAFIIGTVAFGNKQDENPNIADA